MVCVTKYHRKVFDAETLEWLQGHLTKVCGTMDCELLACGGEADHLHATVEYPPKVLVSGLVNALKGTSSRLLRKEWPDIARRYVYGVLWSPSYFAVSTGGDIGALRWHPAGARSCPGLSLETSPSTA